MADTQLYSLGSPNGVKTSLALEEMGIAYDRFTVETLFKSLKAEMVWRTTFETRDQAGKALFKYINKFYNPKRRHSYLGNISPMKFEMKAA